MHKILSLIFALFLSLPALAPAGEALNIGSKAPALYIENWIKGEPIETFQQGTIYVVEFWSTWCFPCLQEMPKLVELQNKYKDQDVVVIAVAATEKAATQATQLRNINRTIAQYAPNVNFNVGFDSSGTMEKTWLKAANQEGIPVAFIIDPRGHITHIQPSQLEDAVKETIQGLLSAKDLASNAEARTAEQLRQHEKSMKIAQFASLMKESKWFRARAVLHDLIPDIDPAMQGQMHAKEAEITLYRLNYTLEGLNLIEKYAKTYNDHFGTLHQLLQVLFTRKNITAHLPTTKKFTIGSKLKDRILTLVEANQKSDKFYAYAPAIAQYYFESGNKKNAIELMEASIDSVKTLPPPVAHIFLTDFAATLADYKDEEVCVGTICARPPRRWGSQHECEITLYSKP